MITKYFNKVVVKFNPASRGARTARMFLASLPPKTRGQILVSQKILQPKSKETEEVTVTYKDGKTISIDPKTIGTTFDMQQTFDQYSRSLKIQEDINDV